MITLANEWAKNKQVKWKVWKQWTTVQDKQLPELSNIYFTGWSDGTLKNNKFAWDCLDTLQHVVPNMAMQHEVRNQNYS